MGAWKITKSVHTLALAHLACCVPPPLSYASMTVQYKHFHAMIGFLAHLVALPFAHSRSRDLVLPGCRIDGEKCLK